MVREHSGFCFACAALYVLLCMHALQSADWPMYDHLEEPLLPFSEYSVLLYFSGVPVVVGYWG